KAGAVGFCRWPVAFLRPEPFQSRVAARRLEACVHSRDDSTGFDPKVTFSARIRYEKHPVRDGVMPGLPMENLTHSPLLLFVVSFVLLAVVAATSSRLRRRYPNMDVEHSEHLGVILAATLTLLGLI